MKNPAVTVQPVHFEDLSGEQFERLVFVYELRARKWRALEWYGQTGTDSGRDIWGELDDGSTVCIQCVNREKLSATKLIRDLDKVARAPSGIPHSFHAVCASKVSARIRDSVKKHAQGLGISRCEIWSASEFEERLRQNGESLLRRFLNGEQFPDDSQELRRLAEIKDFDDEALIERVRRVFDRPAFQTPFHQESSLPGFRQAIADTIQALNTGIWQTRDGKEIERFPSRHDVKSPSLRGELAHVVQDLVNLRARFDQLIRDGKIKQCDCNVPDCQTFFLVPEAAHAMDTLRCNLLARVQKLRSHDETEIPQKTQNVSVVGTTNNGIIANQVTIRGPARPGPIILPTSIGSDPEKYIYVEYLIKRLTQFREAGKSYGQKRGGRIHPGSTRKILENQLGGLPKDLPAERFPEVVAYLKGKIDDTALGRNNRKRNIPNYHSFEEHPPKLV